MKKMLILGLLSLFLVVPTYACKNHDGYRHNDYYRPMPPKHNMRPMPPKMSHGGFYYNGCMRNNFWNRGGNKIGFYFSF